jgi:hypothetical protein
LPVRRPTSRHTRLACPQARRRRHSSVGPDCYRDA